MRDPATTISKWSHSKFKSIGSSNKSFPVKKFPTVAKKFLHYMAIIRQSFGIQQIGNVLVLMIVMKIIYTTTDCIGPIGIIIISFGLESGHCMIDIHWSFTRSNEIEIFGKKKRSLFVWNTHKLLNMIREHKYIS